jgi:thymidylate synthase
MHSLVVGNVCEALSHGYQLIMNEGILEESRAGDVLVMPCPVFTITTHPQQRVLFSEVRDANPFFHLYESIWMLGGRRDSLSLNDFIKTFGARYGEADGTVHDAYGYRWRIHFGFDQLDYIIGKMRETPYTRQCVLQMWDAMTADDLMGNWHSRPCNTHIYTRIHEDKLDITVCCRSNDLIWGAHGANAVHFSVLQEYLAARIGVKVGVMYQLSNNYHAYLSEIEKMQTRIHTLGDDMHRNLYSEDFRPMPMFEKSSDIDKDIYLFLQRMYDVNVLHAGYYAGYSNSWFADVLSLAIAAHRDFKGRRYSDALRKADKIQASDWRVACSEWIQRHEKG